MTDSGIWALGTTVTTSGAAGDTVLKMNGWIRSVNAAGTDTFKLVGTDGTNNNLALNADRQSASVAGNFAANYFFLIRDSAGNAMYVPAMAGSW